MGLEVPEIDTDTLMVSLQADHGSFTRLEGLLQSEPLRDPENITELLMSYDEAFTVSKSVYRAQLEKGADLPPAESIVFDKAG